MGVRPAGDRREIMRDGRKLLELVSGRKENDEHDCTSLQECRVVTVVVKVYHQLVVSGQRRTRYKNRSSGCIRVLDRQGMRQQNTR